jgi:hypothetical protein
MPKRNGPPLETPESLVPYRSSDPGTVVLNDNNFSEWNRSLDHGTEPTCRKRQKGESFQAWDELWLAHVTQRGFKHENDLCVRQYAWSGWEREMEETQRLEELERQEQRMQLQKQKRMADLMERGVLPRDYTTITREEVKVGQVLLVYSDSNGFTPVIYAIVYKDFCTPLPPDFLHGTHSYPHGEKKEYAFFHPRDRDHENPLRLPWNRKLSPEAAEFLVPTEEYTKSIQEYVQKVATARDKYVQTNAKWAIYDVVPPAKRRVKSK